ncbi:heterokaryon incompatibility, partial [Amniculicola lignicola CBS 123094]
NDKPSYAALSYVWGKKTDEERSILIDNTKAIIRPSLYEALQHLQYEDIKPAIWIDAICINQMDVEEKNDQVPRMRAIYSGVRQAIIWLGP